MSSSNNQSEIENRINELEEKFIGDKILNNESFLEKLNERVENVFIKKIFNHPVIKIGKWLLAGFMLLGLAVWGIGSFSNEFQLKNVNDEAKQTILLIKETNSKIETTSRRIVVLEDSIQNLLGENSIKIKAIIDSVSDEAREAKERIEKIKSEYELKYLETDKDSIISLKESIKSEIKSLNTFYNTATEKHQELIEELDKSTENVNSAIKSFSTLDIKAMTAFFSSIVGVTSLLLMILVILSLLFNILLFNKYHKLKKKIE